MKRFVKFWRALLSTKAAPSSEARFWYDWNRSF
jgi:hypothetical protein